MECTWNFIPIDNLRCRIVSGAIFHVTNSATDPGIVICDQNLTSLIAHDLQSGSFRLIGCIIGKDAKTTKHVFEAGEKLSIIDETGDFRQLELPNDNASSEGLFSSSSNNSESIEFSWLTIKNLGTVRCAVGFKSGFAAVDDSGMLSFYDATGQTTAVQSFLESSVGSFYLKCFLTSQFSTLFLKSLISEHILSCHEILLVAEPRGTISVLPVVPNSNNITVKPKQIHYDPSKIVAIDVLPNGAGLLLSHENGKICLMYYCEKGRKITRKDYYLSSNVTNMTIIVNGNLFSIVWSDGMAIWFTLPTNLLELSFNENQTDLRGISKLVKIGDTLLGVDYNGCFFKISVNSGESELIPEPFKTISKISVAGNKVEEIKKKISRLDGEIASLSNESVEKTEFSLRVRDKTLILENLGSRSFPADVWSVVMTSTTGKKYFSNRIPLESDFAPQQCIALPMDKFYEKICREIEVILVGFLSADARLLNVHIGRVGLEIASSSNEIDNVLFKIFQE